MMVLCLTLSCYPVSPLLRACVKILSNHVHKGVRHVTTFLVFLEIISIVNVYTVLTPINFLSSPYLYLQITLAFITSALSGRASCARLKVCKVRDCEGWTRKVNRGASYSPIISPPFALSHEHVTRSFPHPQTIHPNLPARC
jgi:hypothetical protein